MVHPRHRRSIIVIGSLSIIVTTLRTNRPTSERIEERPSREGVVSQRESHAPFEHLLSQLGVAIDIDLDGERELQFLGTLPVRDGLLVVSPAGIEHHVELGIAGQADQPADQGTEKL